MGLLAVVGSGLQNLKSDIPIGLLYALACLFGLVGFVMLVGIEVFKFLKPNPTADLDTLERNFPSTTRGNLSKLRSYFLNGKDHQGNKIKGKGKKKSKVKKKRSQKKTSSKSSGTHAQSQETTETDIKQIFINAAINNNNLKAGEYILEHTALFIKQQPPQYNRPTFLNPKQSEIIDTVQMYKIIFIEGDRRTGKSTAGWVALTECILNGILKWDMWAGKEASAIRLHHDMYRDPLLHSMNLSLVASHTAKKTLWINGGELNIHATTVIDSKGIGGDGIILEEFDQIIKKNPETIAAIFAILRDKPDMKMILLANQGSGAYKLFKEIFKDPQFETDIKFITLTYERSPHIQLAGNDPLISNVLKATMGTEYMKSQLLNEETFECDAFNAVDISEAIKGYDDFMKNMGDNSPIAAVIGVDPGFGHATGIMCLGIYQDHIFEIESHQLYGAKTSEDSIKAVVTDIARSYGAKIVCESNSGGLHWLRHWKDQGLYARAQNFGSDSKPKEARSYYMRQLKLLLEQHKFHFCNTDLRNQLLIYDPEKNKLDAKGDLADATLHAIHQLLKSYPDVIFIES